MGVGERGRAPQEEPTTPHSLLCPLELHAPTTLPALVLTFPPTRRSRLPSHICPVTHLSCPPNTPSSLSPSRTHLAADAQVEGVPVLELAAHGGQRLGGDGAVLGRLLAQEDVVPHLWTIKEMHVHQGDVRQTVESQEDVVAHLVGNGNGRNGEGISRKAKAYTVDAATVGRLTQVNGYQRPLENE